MKRVSLKDIAQKAGVSVSTVSFVLNNKAKEMRISGDQVKKINSIAKNLGYRPNLLARGLRTGSSKTIGLIIENIANQFFAGIAKVIEDEAQAHGYKVFYCSTDNDDKKARTLIHTLLDAHVDGFIVTPTANIEPEISHLLQIKKPLVLFDRFFSSLKCSYVILNNHEMAMQAIDILVKKDYRKIAFVTNNIRMNQMMDRKKGYVEALRKHGIRYVKERVLEVEYDSDKKVLVDEFVDFMTRNVDIDAVVFATNTLGLAGMEALRKLKRKIPRDIAIVSFDDHDVFRLSNPAVSVIEQPIKTMGSRAVATLMRLISEKGNGTYQNVEKGRIIQRESY